MCIRDSDETEALEVVQSLLQVRRLDLRVWLHIAPLQLSALQGRDMKPDAKIKTTDLEQALDYLEGLSFIMRSFDESSRGREGRDILLEGLQAMDSGAMSWKPLRHQAAAGQGWADIADHVDELRRRLLEGFADAAL